MATAELVQVLQQKREILRRLKAQVDAVEHEIETLAAAMKILEKSSGPVAVSVESPEEKPETVIQERSHEGVPHAHASSNIRKAFP